MKGSISRALKCRQDGLHEVELLVGGKTNLISPSLATAGGNDFGFIESIERLGDGEFKINCKDRAARALIPVSIIPNEASVISNFVGSDEESITVETRTLVAITGVEAELELQDLTYTADAVGRGGNDITVEYTDECAFASLIVQDITYTAVGRGVAGNDFTIEYTDTETAGNESATIVGDAIVVEIESGVSTATQVLAAINANTDITDVVGAVISGTAGDAQVTASDTPLAGGGAVLAAVVGSAITIGIEDGVSTATAIKTAADLVAGITALVDITVSGTGSDAQDVVAETNLAGGYETYSAGDAMDANFYLKFLYHTDIRLY